MTNLLELSRLPDWPERLARFVAEREGRPFAWGTNDCCTNAADAVLAMTGVDGMAEFRGTYSTEAEADAARAGRTLFRLLTDKLGRRVPPAFARRGDLVLFDAKDGPALCVCLGRESVGPSGAGLVRVPTLDAKSAFKVG